MQREPNDSERDYDSDNEQDNEGFEASESRPELPAEESGGGRARRAKAVGVQRTRSQSAERATGKSANKRSRQRTGQRTGGTARGKRPARRTRPRAAR